MSKVFVRNNQFIFQNEHGREELLLDSYDRLNNYSRIPLHELLDTGEANYVIYNDILNYINEYDNIIKKNSNVPDKLSVILTIILITKKLLTKQRNYRVLEVGSNSGVLTYYLANILHKFNDNNKLFCVTFPTQENNSAKLLDENMLKNIDSFITFIHSTTDDFYLQSGYFDIVIINGSTLFLDPPEIINQAIRCSKDLGLLICLTERQYLLNSYFQVATDDSFEYPINSFTSVLVKHIDLNDKKSALRLTEEYKISSYKKEIIDNILLIEKKSSFLNKESFLLADQDNDIDELIKLVSIIEDDLLQIYKELNGINIKFNVNNLKESLINIRLCNTPADRSYFINTYNEIYENTMNDIYKSRDFISELENSENA